MAQLLLEPEQLQSMLADDTLRVVVFDVRHDLADHAAGRQAYEQGHIPSAIYLDHERDLSAPKNGRNGRHPLPELPAFAAQMASLGVQPGVQVVVYDAGNSMFAAHLWWMLRWMGHYQVAVLNGGWQAWLAANGGVETGAPADRPAPAAQKAVSISMPVVDAAAVLANLTQQKFVVLDARAQNRYRGETEPMDPVAGHIPGALNRPNSLNCQPDGTFKSAAQLRDEFQAVLKRTPADRVVHQCGSGITACHNLFAMELAGLTGSALYPGSWSEWCSDPDRPVATGDEPAV